MAIPKNGKAATPQITPPVPLVPKALNDIPGVTDASLLAEFGCQPIQVSAKAIGAVRLDLAQGSKRGSFCRLPFRSVVTIVGSGFNEQTVLIRHEDALYVVFRQDLGLPTSEAERSLVII